MLFNVPGTVIQIPPEEMTQVEQRLRALFLRGGVMLGQVAEITGLEPSAIQNWVKRGYLTAPEKKRYSLRQLCRVLNINMLRPAMAMEEICGLLQYVNGHLDDESDDLIDDSQLYFLFIRLLAQRRQMDDPQVREAYLENLLEDYREPVAGGRERVKTVLRIMLTAWASAQLRSSVQKMLLEIKEDN